MFFKSKKIKEFESKFNLEELELIILTEGESDSLLIGNYREIFVNFVAFINVNSQELIKKHGSLRWLSKKRKYKYVEKGTKDIVLDKKGKYLFDKYKIYRVKVRKHKEDNMEQYLLVDIINNNETNEQLENYKKLLINKTIIKEEFGKFTLDRKKSSCFVGKMNFWGNECKIHLNTDSEDGNTAEKAMVILKEIIKNEKEIYDRITEYGTSKFNDIVESDMYDELSKDVSIDMLSKSQINDIHINPQANYIGIYFKDTLFNNEDIEFILNKDFKVDRLIINQMYF